MAVQAGFLSDPDDTVTSDIQLGIVKDARDYDRHYLTRQFNSIGISKLALPILYLASFKIPPAV